ncbi:undecaprenyl-phosphate glucose phosphotransferase [Mucilaginibacter celer]|uniref:Undecaprenyl-phosphate glucose phosphotransferase n=1 Tax=Mucilaginibacter celer TaxID=2305508 RepID=A0A494VWA5_9SPHI|nr:undecaprenyl-phosphate glucose phosphotransferase [Mucilaginibacter celer]AYL95262.1 undecaprenyl-phosphate glucose phosphotransferase [Mucilaginibacter celer]
MKTRYLYVIYFIMSVTDIVVLNLSFFILNYILYPKSIGDASTQMVANYLWLLAALAFGLYTGKAMHKTEDIYRVTIKSFALYTLLFFSYVFLSAHHLSVGLLLGFYLTMFSGLILSRLVGSTFEKSLKKHFKIARPVAVIGLNSMGLRLAGFFQNSDSHFNFEGFLDSENNSFLDSSGNILPAVTDQISSASAKGIKDVYVSLSPNRINEFDRLQREADKHCLRLKLVPDMSTSFSGALQLTYLGDFAVLSHRNEPLDEIENRFKKRLFDVVFSSLVIVFILSWLYPLIAILIKLQSRGPVLFKQLRTGKDNTNFVCYKFRSMKVNNDTDRQATKDDDRITKIGAFLRKTSLDELPQFLNVFLGDMSVIGPRPHPLNMTKEYSQFINQYMVRHFLKSGITGWAQVNGFRGETKEAELMQKRIVHDVWYLEHWSMWLDFKIIYMTIINIFKGEENAY